MCPEQEIVSAYYDDEIKARRRDVVKNHIAGCPECRKVLDSYGTLTDILHKEEEPDFAAAKDRVWAKIGRSIDEKKSAADFWHRKISLSLPAASAFAAIFIVLFFMSFLGYFIGKNSAYSSPELDITDASDHGKNIKTIFDESVINLDIPFSGSFISGEEPFLIREVDFKTMGGK